MGSPLPVAVRTEGLTKRFGKTLALDRLDLEIRPGEMFGFLGSNGAGKSTTVRLLGLIRPSAGRALIFDVDASDAVKAHRHLAYVPADVALWPNLAGAESLALLANLGRGTDHAFKAELISRFDLQVDCRCGTYSTGNRQKVALVAALAIRQGDAMSVVASRLAATLVGPKVARRALLGLDVRLVLRGAIILIAVSTGLTAVVVLQYASTFGSADAARSLELLAQNPAIRTLFGVPRALDDAGGFTVWRTGTIVAVAAAAWALATATRLTLGEEDTGRAWLTLVGPLRLGSALLLHLSVVGVVAVGLGVSIRR
jgi:ABC-type transport system involved in cytochrome c biogenesis ATPase subunit